MINISKEKKAKKAAAKAAKADENVPHKIINFNEGWNRVVKIGVNPYFDRIENVLDQGVLDKVSITKEQFIDTYDNIFTMCIQREPNNHSSALYEKHSMSLSKYYKEKFFPVLTKISSSAQTDDIFLKEWAKRWKCHEWAVKGMTKLFQYLNRFHVPNSEDLLPLTEQGYSLYRDIVFEKFKLNATNSILNCIRNERDGQEQDRELLRDSIRVYTELGNHLKKSAVELKIYIEDFHKSFIQQTREYYKQSSRSKLDNLSAPDYLIYAENNINDEAIRLSAYIDKYSEADLMSSVRDEILNVHLDELLLQKKSGLNNMLERTIGVDIVGAKEDISRMNRLYSKVPGANDIIAKAVREHICSLGLGFIAQSKEKKDENAAHELIKSLIDLHDRFLKIVKVEFQEQAEYHKALKDAFEKFINKEYATSAILARYANDLLKKGSKLANASNLDGIMGHVVMLYGYIRDKDIFEKDYQAYLASRLLQDLSESEQSERSMIGKLKTECGYHWTKKLEDMFKDIQRSKELMQEFNNKSNKDSDIELNVSVCTTGAWPSASIQPIKHPSAIQGICESFKHFYLNRFSGRRLKYQMDKGKADLSVIFNGKKKIKKILVVSTYQMIVLCLFNNKPTWTFGDMLEATSIPREDLESAVISMAHPKVKVMRKSPNKKVLNDTDKFQINPNYNNPRSRVTVPTYHFGPVKNLNIPDPKILVMRKHQMDAAIVRIMKARQTLGHNDLITEVVKQLTARFTPKPLAIKKRIQTLIELEYLERHETERGVYNYKQ